MRIEPYVYTPVEGNSVSYPDGSRSCAYGSVHVRHTKQSTHTHRAVGADKRRGRGGGAVDELLVGLRQSDR